MSVETHVPPDDLVAKTGLFAGMNALMAIASMVMILGFVAFTIQDVEYSSAVFTEGKDFIINTLDWFYVLVVTLALFFVFWLLVSRFGDVKLGKDDDEPDFSTFSWICMLFSAGPWVRLDLLGRRRADVPHPGQPLPDPRRHRAGRRGGGRFGDPCHHLSLGSARLGALRTGRLEPGLFLLPQGPAAVVAGGHVPGPEGQGLRSLGTCWSI